MEFPLALVIEDDKDTSYVLAEALSMAGYAVETIRDGREAMAALNEKVPALVLLDLHLPNVDGESLLAHIRDDERLQATRVMLVTGDDRLAEQIGDDANLVLLKPVSFMQLRALAERIRPPSD